jgi:glycosyltransferase involved in cell wall biosynthesis
MTQSPDRPKTIGVIIPAFNEAENLLRVLNVVCAVDWAEQIVVVDDGSTDDTLNIARQSAARDKRVIAVHIPENQGKAAALLTGVQALSTQLVMFLDADLVGLQPCHLEKLYSPVASGSHKMTVAVFQHGNLFTDASHLLAPNLSGQRCLPRAEAEQALIPLVTSRYGVEVGLTIYARNREWMIKNIIWDGVTHRMKEQKREVIAGLYSRWQMYSQIMAVIAVPRHKSGRGIRWLRTIRRAQLILR